MADVFLSYRNTEDRRAIVARLATILRAHGISVWWDYGLAAGQRYQDQIEAELKSARIVVPFWCEESINSDWVKREATLSMEKLLPVRLQKVAPPPGFESLHAHHLENWNGSILDPQLDELVKAICARLGDASEISPDTKSELAKLPLLAPLPNPGRARPPATAGRPRRWALIAAGVLSLAGVAAAIIAVLPDAKVTPQTASVEPAQAAGAAPPPVQVIAAGSMEALQWHLGSADEGGAGILDYSRRTGARGAGVTIAVIDTGIYPLHPEFVRNPAIIAGVDVVWELAFAGDGDGVDLEPWDPGDACGVEVDASADSQHGTFNASLLAAQGSRGLTGITPEAKVLVVRALGKCGGKLSYINDAIRWSSGSIPIRLAPDDPASEVRNAHPADIIVVPVGVLGPCPHSMQAAISAAVASGSAVVVGAGQAKISVENWAPANCNGVLRVGAATVSGKVAPYSNSGADLLAPGGDMSSDDNGDGRPDGIFGAKFSSENCVAGDGGAAPASCDYGLRADTSVAAMIAAGALGLVRSNHRTEPMPDTVARLRRATRPMDARQCAVDCANRPDAEQIPGLPGQCYLGCGDGRIDLSLAE